jgi:N-glycosidase YbiA
MEIIAFTKVNLPYGWLGNMSPHPLIHEGKDYKTTEALFQCLRFKDHPEIQDQIRNKPSPMSAKMVARGNRHLLNREDKAAADKEDIEYMKVCLNLKLQYHPDLKQLLIETKDARIVEDCSSRPGGSGKFWGAALVNGKWQGSNVLGKLWMNIRNEIQVECEDTPTLKVDPKKESNVIFEEFEF